jgi:aminoglycoside 6'-N-acetyltransferase I
MVTVERVGDGAVLDRVGPDVFDDTLTPELVAAYLQSPGHLLVVAVDDGVVVGMCTAVVHHKPDEAPELYIDELGTASTHRRRGIARRLTEAMLEWGAELGCGEAWLATEEDNTAAIGLYDSLVEGRGGDRQPIVMYSFPLGDG